MAEEKIGIIESVRADKSGTGLAFYHVTLADGSNYKCFSKDLESKVGKEIKYTIEDKGYGPYMKIAFEQQQKKFQPGGGGGGWKGKSPEEIAMTARTMTMAYSKDIVVALINMGIIKDEVNASKWLLTIYDNASLVLKIQG